MKVKELIERLLKQCTQNKEVYFFIIKCYCRYIDREFGIPKESNQTNK